MITETAKEGVTEMAHNLSIVLASKTIEQGIKEAVEAILFDSANESDTIITDARIIEAAFPLIMENLEIPYARGMFLSLQSILEHAISETEFKPKSKIIESDEDTIDDMTPEEDFKFNNPRRLADENSPCQLFGALITHKKISFENTEKIFQFIVSNGILPIEDVKEIAMITGHGYTSSVLDLSAYPTDEDKSQVLDLSSQTTAEDECIDLAKHLSTVLNHSQLPEKIYRVIHEELGMMNQPSDVFNTAEYIAKVLCNQGGENE